MDSFNLQYTLQRLHELLQAHQSREAIWLAELIPLCVDDRESLYCQLNSKHMWGGAGSVANEALADNPGIEEWLWRSEIQEFRELMIALGEHLMSTEVAQEILKGNAYPDISSWLLAFNNWNQSHI